MLDVYHRLHGDEGSFFVPDDMEISLRTLAWILTQAKRWTGFQGSTRKISVTSYVTKDHLDHSFEERTIHLALYTQDIYGKLHNFNLICNSISTRDKNVVRGEHLQQYYSVVEFSNRTTRVVSTFHKEARRSYHGGIWFHRTVRSNRKATRLCHNRFNSENGGHPSPEKKNGQLVWYDCRYYCCHLIKMDANCHSMHN